MSRYRSGARSAQPERGVGNLFGLNKPALRVRRGERLAGLFFAASLCVFSQTTQLWTALLLLVCIGTGFMFMMAGTSTLLQLGVPDEMRGRVMSFHTTVFLGAFPFGGLVVGQLADHYGESPVLLGAGISVACGLLFFGRVLLRATRGATPSSC